MPRTNFHYLAVVVDYTCQGVTLYQFTHYFGYRPIILCYNTYNKSRKLILRQNMQTGGTSITFPLYINFTHLVKTTHNIL